MRIIARSMLRDFSVGHADAAADLDAWYHVVKRSALRTPHEVRQVFPRASFLGGGVTVFDIGLQYRLEVHFRYDLLIVFIRDVMTHAEYDRRNKARGQTRRYFHVGGARSTCGLKIVMGHPK